MHASPTAPTASPITLIPSATGQTWPPTGPATPTPNAADCASPGNSNRVECQTLSPAAPGDVIRRPADEALVDPSGNSNATSNDAASEPSVWITPAIVTVAALVAVVAGALAWHRLSHHRHGIMIKPADHTVAAAAAAAAAAQADSITTNPAFSTATVRLGANGSADSGSSSGPTEWGALPSLDCDTAVTGERDMGSTKQQMIRLPASHRADQKGYLVPVGGHGAAPTYDSVAPFPAGDGTDGAGLSATVHQPLGMGYTHGGQTPEHYQPLSGGYNSYSQPAELERPGPAYDTMSPYDQMELYRRQPGPAYDAAMAPYDQVEPYSRHVHAQPGPGEAVDLDASIAPLPTCQYEARDGLRCRLPSRARSRHCGNHTCMVPGCVAPKSSRAEVCANHADSSA